MRRLLLILLALPIAAPSMGFAEVGGEVNVGLRANDFDEESARFDEYRDMSDGLFGSADVLMNDETYFLGASVENPFLDDQYYDLRGGVFGAFKGEVFYDELTHNLSYDALSPATGIGSDTLVVPSPVPAVSAWTPFDYDVEVKTLGADITVDTQNPFYFKVSADQQRKEGVMPYGLFDSGTFMLALPVDYTTYTTMVEAGYRSKETTAVFNAGYSDFDNDNDLLTLRVGSVVEEYSMPADNYAYNLGGRLTQRLPMESLLALKAAFSQNVSEADFGKFLTSTSPTADEDFDGDIRYIRGSAVLTSQWSKMLDTRLFYNYIDRDNQSENITVVTEGEVRRNHLLEYDKHQAGLDANYRLNKVNKLTGGYEFTGTDRTRDDADTTYDNLLFGEVKNTAIDWMMAKFRLEYLNRSSDTDYEPEDLEGDGLIRAFFTPFDYASKDRYKGKLSFDFTPMEKLAMAVSYALEYDDYDASMFGLQEDFRHEIYTDVNARLPAKIQLNGFAGYEYTESDFESRRYNPGGADPTLPTTSTNFNWSEEFDYDFFVFGGNLKVPVLARLELVASADYQIIDGNIDFARSAAAGAPLGTVTEADDYYKTRAGMKGIYKLDDHWSATLGYGYEKSNLDDWRYDNFTYRSGTVYLSGAGLDRDYEVHQVYLITSYRF
ncbi:MAG: hypothetical protein A2X81_09965 [Desulfobacterales bacterium GWB2_56_26]|nr:MAG: hypothetical protein A2X81_09965 [Desulfobacterales bacterium GWB2_56_26]